MLKMEEWVQINIDEIKKRAVNFSNVSIGNVIVFSANNTRIDFVSCNENHNYKTIKTNIIDYKKLKSAKSLEKRLKIVVDALRDISIQFYFDNRVIDLILKG